MEPFAGVNMTVHPCYNFMMRMKNCIQTEEFSSRMCFEEVEDWYECKNRRKSRAFYNFLRVEH
jgi:hypothetical protein